MTLRWQDRHPFTLGQIVRPVPGLRGLPGPDVPLRVWMRGESERGLWIAFEGVPYEFRAADFFAAVDDPILMPDAGEAA